MSTANFDVPDLPLPVTVRRMATARRMRLRVDGTAGLIKLTVPARTSARAALLWARQQRPWIEQQLASAPPAVPLVPGAFVPFRGGQLTLEAAPGARRAAELGGDTLAVSGPPESFARTAERWLRRQAMEVLSRETARVAALAGVGVTSVAIGDPVSRWGSCTSAGAIRYSWRLILAPPRSVAICGRP